MSPTLVLTKCSTLALTMSPTLVLTKCSTLALTMSLTLAARLQGCLCEQHHQFTPCPHACQCVRALFLHTRMMVSCVWCAGDDLIWRLGLGLH